MSVAGDCRLMMSHVNGVEEWERYREQMQAFTDIDVEIKRVIEEIGFDENLSEFIWLWELTGSIERNLSASAHAYEYAINLVRTLNSEDSERLNMLIKRVGNVRNEMGVFWMNQCAQLVKHLEQQDEKVRENINPKLNLI